MDSESFYLFADIDGQLNRIATALETIAEDVAERRHARHHDLRQRHWNLNEDHGWQQEQWGVESSLTQKALAQLRALEAKYPFLAVQLEDATYKILDCSDIDHWAEVEIQETYSDHTVVTKVRRWRFDESQDLRAVVADKMRAIYGDDVTEAEANDG